MNDIRSYPAGDSDPAGDPLPADDSSSSQFETTDRAARLRWGAYLLLITLAVGNMAGRILAV
ncbi:MAG: hypothetical protein N2C12_06460, partial [Planctomycetales bacterium]